MSENLILRPMAPEDLPALRTLYERSWRWAYKDIIPQSFMDSVPAEGWAGGVQKEGRRNLVLTEDGRVVGTTSFCPSRWWKYPDYGEIVSLYLLPEYMGMGYGGRLLARAMDELRGDGFGKFLLWVLKDNQRARRFYEKHGFTLAGEYREELYDGEKVGEVLYIYGDAPLVGRRIIMG